VLQLVTDYPTVQVLHVAAQLRLADLLAAGPQRIEDLAAATGRTRLRWRVSCGCSRRGRISLTPVGAPLRGRTGIVA